MAYEVLKPITPVEADKEEDIFLSLDNRELKNYGINPNRLTYGNGMSIEYLAEYCNKKIGNTLFGNDVKLFFNYFSNYVNTGEFKNRLINKEQYKALANLLAVAKAVGNWTGFIEILKSKYKWSDAMVEDLERTIDLLMEHEDRTDWKIPGLFNLEDVIKHKAKDGGQIAFIDSTTDDNYYGNLFQDRSIEKKQACLWINVPQYLSNVIKLEKAVDFGAGRSETEKDFYYSIWSLIRELEKSDEFDNIKRKVIENVGEAEYEKFYEKLNNRYKDLVPNPIIKRYTKLTEAEQGLYTKDWFSDYAVNNTTIISSQEDWNNVVLLFKSLATRRIDNSSSVEISDLRNVN